MCLISIKLFYHHNESSPLQFHNLTHEPASKEKLYKVRGN